MCGITSVSLAEKSSIFDLRSFMRCAVMAIENRGADATGFAWSQPDGQGIYWKDPSTAYLASRKAPLPREATVILGHTRYSTGGSKSIPSNNHPIVDDGIMLIHNGTVNNEYMIYRTLFDLPVPQNTVDTAALALLLSHRESIGCEHPADALTIPTGSAALAWIEADDPHSMHLARTVERPLTIAWTRKGDMVMSSTPETLWHLSLMTNIKFRHVTEIEEGIYLKVHRGEVVETREFEPRRYNNTTWSSQTSHKEYVANSSGQLELVKGKDDKDYYDEDCRWFLDDMDIPKDIPWDDKSIRAWRNACECNDCMYLQQEHEEMRELDERAAFLADFDTYEYNGRTMVWDVHTQIWVPVDEFIEDYGFALLGDKESEG